MPEPFKNSFNRELIAAMAGHLAPATAACGASSFDEAGFQAAAGRDLDTLELKERSSQIATALHEYLPEDFPTAAEVLRASLHPGENTELAAGGGENAHGIRSWAVMPMSQFVARHGLDHFDLSLELLSDMTKRFSSEFAIRSFLLADPGRTLEVMESWVRDPNHHVRRLVSEGTRPRLPWAERLPAFIEDPSPLLPLLEALRDDSSEYVRPSVANNLNDIAKDHPDLVAEIAHRWLKGASKDRERLVRHACRTLIKQGHSGALAALGYGPPRVTLEVLKILTPIVRLGEKLAFEVVLRSDADEAQRLVLDYVIHHRKANGQTSPKVFKWKTLTLEKGKTHGATRRHAIRPITTRKYYPGTHFLELQVNGRVMGREEFELEV